MLRHALRLVWNRRRGNALVIIEIAAAFIATFVLLALATTLWTNYQRPLGFEYENIWNVNVNKERSGGFGFAPFGNDTIEETVADVTGALGSLPQSLEVAPILLPPFVGYRFNDMLGADADNLMLTNLNRTTNDALRAMGVRLTDGRWFEPADESAPYRAALVNHTFVERAFGSGVTPIGQSISFPDPNAPPQQVPEWQVAEALRPVRIVGVVEDFRQWGEFTESTPYALQLFEEIDARGESFNLLIKVEPATNASFEEEVIAAVEAIAPGWTAAVTPWAQSRATTHANTLLPIKVASTVAAFFLALVVMGLIGVLWQDVVRRTQEIGLRRALGATASTVRRQIQLEMLVVGGFGILIGTVFAIQFPLLSVVDDIDWAASVPALVLSAALITMLIFVGSLYPSWLASRREPADALRYE